LFVSCLIAPFLKYLFDAMVISGSFIKELVNFKEGSYDFGRVMRRIILAVAAIGIYIFRKPLRIGSFATVGIKHTSGWWEQLRMGFYISTGIFILYLVFLWGIGIKVVDIDFRSAGDLFVQLFKILLIAGIVACIEEVFFRGFIFQSLLADMRAVPAICISSIFYSLLHFFKAKYSVSPGIQPFVGFAVIFYSFENIVVNISSILPSVIGLFLVGVVLSYACLRTKSLYFAIGLHAGWVFLIKANRLFLDHAGKESGWLYGDSKVVTGILGWILLMVTLILVRFVTGDVNSGKDTARIG